jgi:hypothetical protein
VPIHIIPSKVPTHSPSKASPGFIFIDANQYLTLYNVIQGKKLLPALIEQQEHIFVTAQVVDEVQRRKLEIAKKFYEDNFQFLKLVDKFQNPALLFDVSSGTAAKLKKVVDPIAKNTSQIETVFKAAIVETLDRISHSTDDVSIQLDKLFKNAVIESDKELDRARTRKERGNPPGKHKDVLGDQVNWEQVLSKYRMVPKVWLIIQDVDFFMKYGGKCILNPLLYRDLRAISDPPQCYCFDDLDRGLGDFALRTGIPAKNLPAGKEAEHIQEEWAAASTAVSTATSTEDKIAHFMQALPGSYVLRLTPGPAGNVIFPMPPPSPKSSSDEEQPPKENK